MRSQKWTLSSRPLRPCPHLNSANAPAIRCKCIWRIYTRLPARSLACLEFPFRAAEAAESFPSGCSSSVRRKTPIPLDPELFAASKEAMLAELRSVRERTLAFLEETYDRNLRAYYWPHPFLGKLNFYNWFTFIAAHEIRHTKQMVEITKNLPKRVVTS